MNSRCKSDTKGVFYVKTIKRNPRLMAGLTAFLLGSILFLIAALGIFVYTSPRDACVETWEQFHEQYSKGILTEIRVYSRANIFQCRTTSGSWYSFPRGTNSLRNFAKVRYMEDVRAYMLLSAAVSCLFLAPMTAGTAVIKSYKKAQRAPVSAAPSPQQPLPQQPVEPKLPPKTSAPEQPVSPPPKTDSLALKPNLIQEGQVTFLDIAGYEETKRDMEFVVKCLRKPELLRQVGAKIPAGILLYGPPGTGKTLMAKAIAGTAGVHFYSTNASEFIRRYVGVGAENVQALYREARAHAPSIVFIDEIDAIGGARGGEQENQEYRQTLNALLTEMDGLSKDSGVMTIAATNDFEHLDSALIRPGRFDRKIAVPLPNFEDRLAIIRLYVGKKNLSQDVSLESLARDTSGLAGSGIAALFNEAALNTVMHDRGIIQPEDIDAALTKILTNGADTKTGSQIEMRTNAYHEAGHAIILRLLAGIRVPKVTIVGNTNGAAGITFFTENETVQYTSRYLRNRIVAVYGGRAAEELVFGKENITAGASDDIKTATRWIKEYLQGGLGDSLLDPDLFGSLCGVQMDEARALSRTLYQEALSFLTAHREALDIVAEALMQKDTLTDAELEALL